MSVTDITTRMPFRPDEQTQDCVEVLRDLADELERGEYGQIEYVMAGLINDKHTFFSRLPCGPESDPVWVSMARNFANAIRRGVWKV